MQTRRYLGLWLGTLLAAGCASLPHPTPVDADRAHARYPEANLATLTQGRRVYVNKCAGCHSLQLPQSRSAKVWPKLLDEMQREQEVEFASGEREIIEQFLVTMSEHRPN